MTPKPKTQTLMHKSTKKSRAEILTLSLLAAALISTSSTGCKGPVVIVSADQREIVVRSNEVFRAEMDGVFMGMGRYQRYRRAVADKIQEVETR